MKEEKKQLKNSCTNQNRSDLLKAFQESGFWGSGSCFLALLFLPKNGLNNFFKTFWKPEPRRECACFAWVTRGIVGATLTSCGWKTTDLGNPDSDMLRCSNMALLRWDSKDSLSNWSNRVLCSSPNLFLIMAISSIIAFGWMLISKLLLMLLLQYHFH